MSPTTQEYVTPAEAADDLDVSVATVTRWVREGYIHGVRRSPSHFGKGRIRIPRSEIERLLADPGDAA